MGLFGTPDSARPALKPPETTPPAIAPPPAERIVVGAYIVAANGRMYEVVQVAPRYTYARSVTLLNLQTDAELKCGYDDLIADLNDGSARIVVSDTVASLNEIPTLAEKP